MNKIWNTIGAYTDIIIRPSIYKASWFIALIIVILVLLIFLFYKYHIKTIRKANSKLSQLVKERTTMLETMNREIEEQNKEILKQRDLANIHRDQIVKQKEELEIHRNNLSNLVDIRTKELLEAKQKAEEGNKLKTVFLEIINHKIRTPMNAILGFINLLSEKIDDPNSRSFYLKILQESGRNLLHLIEDIIDFSRIHTDELKISCELCDINDMIKQLVNVYRERASREKPEINILIEIPDEPSFINSDPKKISQIISHLIDNCFRFTEKGFIKIGIKETTDDSVALFVEDSGKHMPQEALNNFYDRFYHVSHNNPDILQRDADLGLALSRYLIELLGGKICANNIENGGIAFEFTISRNNQHETPIDITEKDQEASYYWPGKKIIIAEDDETNYLLIEAIFKDTGVELFHAEDGVEFLEIIEKNPKADLVLLDIRMPRLNGLNAIKIVRETMKDVPVIAQTAYDHGYHREKAIESGCNQFMTKPLKKAELLKVVKYYLG